MGKIKTHRASAKRFKVTKGGKVKFNHMNRRHFLVNKSTKRKRDLRGSAYISDAMADNIKKMLPYA